MATSRGALTLGEVIEQFNHLYPNPLSETVKRRIIWRVDRAFAVETGRPEPKEYSTATPKATKLLVPKLHRDVYWWAMLRDKGMDISEGAREHYSKRYAEEKKVALATWRAAKKGGIDLDEQDFFGRA